jgi:putative SOS response-associated peptidase YedK
MCAGIFFKDDQNPELTYKIYFPIPYAKIPIISKNGVKETLFWGRRNKDEFSDTNLPVTGWAKIESIKKGWWHKFNPEKVYIPALKFMEKDNAKKSHWFDVEDGKFIVGLKVTSADISVCYIVTIPTPKEFIHIHNRWVLLKGFGE